MVIKEQIGFRSKGMMAENEDWWHLCYDTDTQEFYVEHSWHYVQVRGLCTDGGSERVGGDDWRGQGSEKIPAAKKKILSQVDSQA